MTERPIALALPLIVLLAPSLAAADAPRASSFFPGGGRIGDSFRVEANGSFDPWPVEVLVDRPGLSFEPEEEAGAFNVTIDDDASPGLYWVRLYNAEGAASLLPFLVGNLPEVVEEEPNDADDVATEVDPSGTVVNGRLEKAGDVDTFAMTLDAGQAVTLALDANDRLGSPMDGKLHVVAPGGFVVDHADDSPLLDPSLVFTAPTSGTYLVRVFAFPAQPDQSIRFSGGADYVYRLTITDDGHLDLAHPSIVTGSQDEPGVIGVGWNLDDDGPIPLELDRRDDGGATARHPDLSGFAEVVLTDLPVTIAGGDADEDAAHSEIPTWIAGQLSTEAPEGKATLLAEPGSSVALRVEARSFGSPIDAVLRVEDSEGNLLAEGHDARREPDPRLSAKVPDDGLLVVRVRDLHRRSGPRFLYRVEARPDSPGYALRVDVDHVALTPDEPLKIGVDVNRRGGLKESITIGAEGLPDGVTFEPVVSEAEGDSSRKVTLELTSDEGTPAWSGPIRLIGLIDPDDSAEPEAVTADRVDGSRTDAIWLTVIAAP